ATGGMAADSVADLIVYPGDATCQTLLAVHGQAAGGISRSRNGGQNWDVVNPDYSFHRILAREKNSTEIFLFGSARTEPDIQNLYSCSTPSELAVEILRDKLFTDMAFAPTRAPGPLYATTSDGGLYRVNNGDHEVTQPGSKDASWSSVGAMWGPNADVLRLCFYDPSRLGLVFSDDELATSQTCRGPLVSSLVKEGAFVRPNANGTVFYAVANNTLSIGRTAEPFPVVAFSPAVMEPAREDETAFADLMAALRTFSKLPAGGSAAKAAVALNQSSGDPAAPYRRSELTLTARVPVTPAPPAAVTADLSRLGGGEATPLYDDGLHGDGAAGDGVYGLGFCFRPLSFSARQDDWRRTWPGRIAAGVSAVYADGSRYGAVGVVGIYPKILSYDLWARNTPQKLPTEGDVAVATTENPPKIHGGTPALQIQVKKGPWSVAMRFPFGHSDITSYQGLSFWVKATEGTPPAEIYVQLRDKPTLTAPVTTERVPVIAEGTREGSIGSEYRCVTIPLSRLLGENSTLEKSKVFQLILSGDGEAPATLLVDCPRILATTEEVIPYNEAPSK
ncbi:MAG: hypothetical protein PHQ12_13035, partial [Chthoniobacteraceae bacterium]|nr:hypothetical protein [Chthoniobacteraceae bacterium]